MDDKQRIKNSIKSIISLRAKLKGTTYTEELKIFKAELNDILKQKESQHSK